MENSSLATAETCSSHLLDIYNYADNARYQHQSFSQWIRPSGKSTRTIASFALELFKLWVSTSQNTHTVNIILKDETKTTVKKETVDKEEEKKKTEKSDQNFRILVAISGTLGIFGLSHLISKDYAKVKEAKELEKEVAVLDYNRVKWSIDEYESNNKFIEASGELFQKVRKNTTNLKIVPRMVTLAGCVFGVVGALYKSNDFMKVGGLFVIGGVTIKIIVNNLYAKADQEIYQLAHKVCAAVPASVLTSGD